MSDAPPPPRRPILKLKIAPAPKPEPSRPAPFAPASPFGKPAFARPGPRRPPPAPPPVHGWKCKPCGTGFSPTPDPAEPEWARCPSCNARVGRLADFLADPPNVEKLRARQVKR